MTREELLTLCAGMAYAMSNSNQVSSINPKRAVDVALEIEEQVRWRLAHDHTTSPTPKTVTSPWTQACPPTFLPSETR